LELLAMYREKQQTLQELMKENANEPRLPLVQAKDPTRQPAGRPDHGSSEHM
jgi:hypothetical protein